MDQEVTTQIQPRRPKNIEHRRYHSICCRPEVAGGVVLSCDVKAVCYVVENFEVASCSNFRGNREKKFPDAEAGGGADYINAICSRPEVVDDVISACNVETFLGYQAANL